MSPVLNGCLGTSIYIGVKIMNLHTCGNLSLFLPLFVVFEVRAGSYFSGAGSLCHSSGMLIETPFLP